MSKELLKAAEANGRTEVRLEQLHELIEQVDTMNKKLDQLVNFVDRADAAVEKIGTHPVFKNMIGRLM